MTDPWVEPPITPITSSWTEPALAVIASTWTQQSATVATLWGEGYMANTLTKYTKAGLPAASSSVQGDLAYVTDSTRGVWSFQGSQWYALNGEIANVKEFGAKGDGVTDDAAAIQAAVNVVQTAARSGCVFFPPGSYYIRTAISITSGVGLLSLSTATGSDATRITTDQAINLISINTTGGGFTVRIEGFNLNGGTNGIEVLSTSGYLSHLSSFRRLAFTNQTNSGLKVTGGPGGTALMIGQKHESLYFSSTGAFGIWAEGGTIFGVTQFDNLRITGATTAAIHLKNTTAGQYWATTQITNAIFEANPGMALDLYSVVVNLRNPHFETNGTAAGVADISLSGDGTTIGGATIYGGLFSTAGGAQTNRISFGANAQRLFLDGTIFTGANQITGGGFTGGGSSIVAVNAYNLSDPANYAGGAYANVVGDIPTFFGGRMQSFLVFLQATAGGVTQHKIVSVADTTTTSGNWAGKVTGASTTLQNTPSVNAATAFTTGVGINAADTSTLILDVPAQLAATMLTTATVVDNTTGTAWTVWPNLTNINVNGTTRLRLSFTLRNAATGVAANLTALGASNNLWINVVGFVQ